MSAPSLPVTAARKLLQEVCAILAPFRDDAVLIGGWVPEIRFPDAFPSHVGSIEVDFAVRVTKARHAEITHAVCNTTCDVSIPRCFLPGEIAICRG